MHRLVIAAAAAMLLILTLAQSATAVAPIRQDLPPFHQAVVLSGVCPFPVTVDSNLTGFQTIYLDQNGNPTRIDIDTREQDTFSANGKTLVGDPYTFKLLIVFDRTTGATTHIISRGVVSRVRLPDGSLFLTAGFVDFIDHPDEPFVLQPDHGAQGNIAGFCAALSP